MTYNQLSIRARFRPEIMERILRVIRHRGFRVCVMTMVQPADSEHVDLDLTVAGLRPVDGLSAQLSKVLDVVRIDVRPAAARRVAT